LKEKERKNQMKTSLPKYNMPVKKLYICTALLLVFANSCMVGPKYGRPTTQPNDKITYHETYNSDTLPLVKWFDLYHDTVLQNLIKQTLDSNRDLLTAAARIEEARAVTGSIKANLYPNFSYQAQAGGGKAGTDAQKIAAGVSGGLLSAFGVLNWELDVWGKLRHSTNAARNTMLANTNERNALIVSLVAEMASSYFLLRDLDNRLEIAQKTLSNRKENTRIISDRFDKGYVSELDKLQAIQQESATAAAIPAFTRQIVQTENAMRVLMGMGPGKIARGNTLYEQTLPEIPVGLPSQLLERRPDILASEYALKAQTENIGVAEANRYPSISLTGILGFASPQLSSFVSSNGFVANGFGSILGPIFNFNKNKKLVEVERKRTEAIYYEYQKTVLLAFSDVDNALTYYRTYSDEITQRKIQVQAALKSLSLSNARYYNGYTSYLEVQILENNLYDAQIDESIAIQQQLNSVVLLYKALGGGW
jgi:multidrug efflux system outer membrane protein